ncbi:hypothetical protein BGX21_010983 [Mortierella sp. AD011]|nr:hypothetical protein BGX21_010983 [Mortierella sp. AD011]
MSLLRTAIRPAARLRLSAAPVTIAVRQLSFKPIYTSETTVKGGPGTNPEELFGGGYAACFGGALAVAAKELKLNLGSETTITTLVSIGPKPKGFQLAVELKVANSGLEGENFNKATDLAHEICPFSHAVKGNIEVKTVKA